MNAGCRRHLSTCWGKLRTRDVYVVDSCSLGIQYEVRAISILTRKKLNRSEHLTQSIQRKLETRCIKLHLEYVCHAFTLRQPVTGISRLCDQGLRVTLPFECIVSTAGPMLVAAVFGSKCLHARCWGFQ
jgi:hypothetical protein